MLTPLAGLAAGAPFLPHTKLIAAFLPTSLWTGLAAAGLLLTSRSLELVLGSLKLGCFLTGSLVATQLVAFAYTGTLQLHATALGALVALEVLYFAACPYRRVLELSPRIRIGSGTVVALVLLLMTETANDVFNVACGATYAVAYWKLWA